MKKIIVTIFLSMLMITGTVSVSALFEKNDTSSTSLLDGAPTWNVGDSWTYAINDFTVNYEQSGQMVYFKGKIDDFILTVSEVGQNTYTVGFTGKLDCGYAIYLSTTNGLSLYLIGSMKPTSTRLQGSIVFTKSNLQIRDITGEIRGITMAQIDPLPFAIPLPFKASVDGDLSTDFPLFKFPLSSNKFWEMPSMSIEMKMNVGGIFGLIQIPVTFITQYGWTPLAFHCRNKQSISVQAGTFDAWEIQSTFFDLFRYYYAPAVGNVVKIDASLSNGEVSGELLSTNVV